MQVNANTGYSAEISLKVVFFGIERVIEPKGDKRYIRLDEKGRINESDDHEKSLSQDR